MRKKRFSVLALGLLLSVCVCAQNLKGVGILTPQQQEKKVADSKQIGQLVRYNLAVGDTAKALQQFQEMFSIWEDLVAADPQKYLGGYIADHLTFVDVCNGQKYPELYESVLKRATDISSSSLNPQSSPELWDGYSLLCWKYNSIESYLGKDTKNFLDRMDANPHINKQRTSASWVEYGARLYAAELYPQAAEAFGKSVKCREWLMENQTHEQEQPWLANSYMLTGLSLWKADEKDEARKAFASAQKVIESIAWYDKFSFQDCLQLAAAIHSVAELQISELIEPFIPTIQKTEYTECCKIHGLEEEGFIMLQLFAAYANEQNYPMIMKNVDRLSALVPELEPTLSVCKGEALMKMGQAGASIAYLESNPRPEVDGYNSTLWTSYYVLGDSLKNLREYGEAVKCYEKAEKIMSFSLPIENVQMSNHLLLLKADIARSSYWNKEYAKADSVYAVLDQCEKQLLAVDESYASHRAYNQKMWGYVLRDMDRHDEAVAKVTEAADIYRKLAQGDSTYLKSYASVQNELAYIYLPMGKLDKALETVELAIAACPEDANYYDSKGEILMKMGKVDEALDMWKKVLDLNPKFFEENGETELSKGLKEKGLISE